MTNSLVSIGVLLAYLMSTYGWGRLFIKLFYRDTPNSWAYAVALGLCSWIFLGGILNLIQLAYPLALDGLFVVGLYISLAIVIPSLRNSAAKYSPLRLFYQLRATSQSGITLRADIVPVLIILSATGFVIATLMPTAAFNFHDDFHIYLVSPVRMLQTGTLGGGPFELVGVAYLGTQSFLQSFILSRFAPEYINGFDFIFCFLVAGLLINDIGRKVDVHWLYRTLAILAFVFINPQYVNISALYSGALFILGLIYSTFLLADTLDARDMRFPVLSGIATGLFVASLISLKATFIPFTLLYSAMLLFGLMLMERNRKRVAAIGGVSAGTACVVLVPWIVISFNTYGKASVGVFEQLMRKSAQSGDAVVNWGRLTDFFFSRAELFFGASLLDYNFTIVTILAAGLISIYLLPRNSGRPGSRHLVVGLCAFTAATVTYLINAYLFSLDLADVEELVRYFAPVIIAVVPASTLVVGRLFWVSPSTPPGGVGPTWRLAIMFVACQGMVLGLFMESLLDRAARARDYRTSLSFPLAQSEDYLAYNRFALSDEPRDRFLKIQSVTDQGETILAWVSMPFHLDFDRNSILTMEWPGLVVGEAEKPFDGDPEEFRKFLKRFGIRYVMWQFKGYGMRSERPLRGPLQPRARRQEARMYLNLMDVMRSLAGKSKVVYKDNRFVLLDIKN